MLLADVAKVNPMVLKRFAEEPEMKKQQLDNLKQLLAFASQAKKEGLTNEPHIKQELENIRSEVTAATGDAWSGSGRRSHRAFGRRDLIAKSALFLNGPGLSACLGLQRPHNHPALAQVGRFRRADASWRVDNLRGPVREDFQRARIRF